MLSVCTTWCLLGSHAPTRARPPCHVINRLLVGENTQTNVVETPARCRAGRRPRGPEVVHICVVCMHASCWCCGLCTHGGQTHGRDAFCAGTPTLLVCLRGFVVLLEYFGASAIYMKSFAFAEL